MPQLKLIQGRKSGELMHQTVSSKMVEMLQILANETPSELRLTRIQFKRIPHDWQMFFQGDATIHYQVNIYGETREKSHYLVLRDFLKRLNFLGLLTHVTFQDGEKEGPIPLKFKLEATI
ncbi:MAG: hypothetical protein D6732_13845 [Methanobacteriota archaeon]|nr:MAG: hypothetical protein D6732_13845 [Euryarchaeota archaeon]